MLVRVGHPCPMQGLYTPTRRKAARRPAIEAIAVLLIAAKRAYTQ